MKKIVLFLFVLLLEITSAQDISGNLEGRVADKNSLPLSGVNISSESESLQGIKGTTTDDYGFFFIPALPVGIYKIQISIIGFKKVVYNDVQIRLGSTSDMGVIILPEQLFETDEIIISGSKPLIDPSSTAYGGNISSKDFENLPMDRNYQSIAALLPLANTSYLGDEINFAGATGGENKYFIDGVDATDTFLGATGTKLPYNFIREVEVRGGGYEAEYPSSLGGIVNVITPSGGNEFHGSVSGFFTSNKLTADKKIGLLDRTQGGFSDYDFGFGIGGPLLRDKFWFYAAYNPKFQRSIVAVPGFGSAIERNITHSFAGKLTLRVSPSLNLSLTTTGDPMERHAVGEGITPAGLANPDPYFSDQKHGGINFSLRTKYNLKENILIEAAISRSTRKGMWQASTERGKNEILFINEETGVWSGGLGFHVNRFIYSNVYSINGTIISGSHLLKAGLQFKTTGVDEYAQGERIIRFSDSSYEWQKDSAKMTVGTTMPSIYLQDNWRIFNFLRLNLGIRGENQYITNSNGTVSQKFLNELQPRAGLVFLPADDGSKKIFLSVGRFYQELSTVLSESYSDRRFANAIRYKRDPRIDQSAGDTVYAAKPIIPTEVHGVTGQHYDEINLGYEQLFADNMKITLQGVYRTLKEAVEQVYFSPDFIPFGNPGKDQLSFLPKAQRDYTALSLSIQKYNDNFNFLASYTISRNYGNYPGLYDAYNRWISPNSNAAFDYMSDHTLSKGLLPNDKTHVFKFAGSYSFDFNLSAGVYFTWQSGTPLTDMAWSAFFLGPRGTSGRTPSIWDLSFRFVYNLSDFTKWQTQFLLDVFHVASQQKPVDIEQQHYFRVDDNGKPIFLNPDYGRALRYQPAMSVRLGIETGF